jgi:lysozyme family protein
MSDIDLKGQFEKISDTAKTATDKVKAAGERTRDQLEADVATARDRATAAVDRMKDKADTARDNASSEWQEFRDKWHAHVAKVRARAHEKKDHIDAHNAAVNADMVEAYAYDAIDFALDAIEEAEYASLAAIYARADAEALKV